MAHRRFLVACFRYHVFLRELHTSDLLVVAMERLHFRTRQLLSGLGECSAAPKPRVHNWSVTMSPTNCTEGPGKYCTPISRMHVSIWSLVCADRSSWWFLFMSNFLVTATKNRPCVITLTLQAIGTSLYPKMNRKPAPFLTHLCCLVLSSRSCEFNCGTRGRPVLTLSLANYLVALIFELCFLMFW